MKGRMYYWFNRDRQGLIIKYTHPTTYTETYKQNSEYFYKWQTAHYLDWKDFSTNGDTAIPLTKLCEKLYDLPVEK